MAETSDGERGPPHSEHELHPDSPQEQEETPTKTPQGKDQPPILELDGDDLETPEKDKSSNSLMAFLAKCQTDAKSQPTVGPQKRKRAGGRYLGGKDLSLWHKWAVSTEMKCMWENEDRSDHRRNYSVWSHLAKQRVWCQTVRGWKDKALREHHELMFKNEDLQKKFGQDWMCVKKQTPREWYNILNEMAKEAKEEPRWKASLKDRVDFSARQPVTTARNSVTSTSWSH